MVSSFGEKKDAEEEIGGKTLVHCHTKIAAGRGVHGNQRRST